jgi:hypothetical protein
MADTANNKLPLINYAEAGRLTRAIGDRITWHLVAMASTIVVVDTIAVDKRLPDGEFDMLFFTHIMCNVCSRHNQLRELLS